MRILLIEKMKLEIELNLKNFLREEGIELYIAANDSTSPGHAYVELENLLDTPLTNNMLLTEIKVVLGILGKPSQCEMLAHGIYAALQPHQITQRELTILLMSLHIEKMHCVRPRHIKKRLLMRYIIETPPANDDDATFEELPHSDEVDAECC